MSYRRDLLLSVGGFAPVYGGIGDWSEPDAAFRVKALGYALYYNPRAAVVHQVSQQGVFKDRGKDSFQRMRNFMYFYARWIRPNTPSKSLPRSS